MSGMKMAKMGKKRAGAPFPSWRTTSVVSINRSRQTAAQRAEITALSDEIDRKLAAALARTEEWDREPKRRDG